MHQIRQHTFLTVVVFLSVLLLSPACLARRYASIVVDAHTGKIYHQANPDVITHPASLTKMMTLYLTFKALRERQLRLDQKLYVSHHASRQAPSKLDLKPGTNITVRHAIRALAIKSANDAAVVIAEALGKGSEVIFARLMTQEAQRLGMKRTIFKNASGLPNPKQITTARDMATLSRALYKHFPEYCHYFKERSFVFKGQVHHNHNKLLAKVKGVIGLKTGFINASGFNLAASMVRNNRMLIAVVLGGETAASRDRHIAQLLEQTFRRMPQLRKYSPRETSPYASLDELINSGKIDDRTCSLPMAQQSRSTGRLRTVSYQSLDDMFESLDGKTSPLKTKKSSTNPSKKKRKKRRSSF